MRKKCEDSYFHVTAKDVSTILEDLHLAQVYLYGHCDFAM